MSSPTRLWLNPPGEDRRAPLSRAVIVDAALKILSAESLSAVTMRRVAEALQTGPASLYAHVASKDDLHTLMFDRIVGDIEVPEPDPSRWAEQVKDVVRRMRDVMVARPGIATVAIAQIPIGPEALRVSDGLIGILRAGGLPDKVVAYAVDLLPLYATAIAHEAAQRGENGSDHSGGHSDHEAFVSELGAFFAQLPTERYPNIAALGPVLVSGEGDERFEFGLDVLVSGLAAYGQPTG